jgi:hypothetical protein
VPPWTVRNSAAGERTPAEWGHTRVVAEDPRAIVNAVRAGSLSVFSVTRNAVAPETRLTRSSTRSAPLFAKVAVVG